MIRSWHLTSAEVATAAIDLLIARGHLTHDDAKRLKFRVLLYTGSRDDDWSVAIELVSP